MSGSTLAPIPEVDEDPAALELQSMSARDPSRSLEARTPNAQHLQNAIEASGSRDQSERQGWRGLSQDDARSILQQQGIEISQENVEYLRRDWDYENAGCSGLVEAMRSERRGWGGFRADALDFSHRTSLGNAAGLSLGQVERAFEARTRQVLEEAIGRARTEANSNGKYKYVMNLQARRGFVDLEGQGDFSLESQFSRASQEIVSSPSYRLAMSSFVNSYNELFEYLLVLQHGIGEAGSSTDEKSRLLELCKAFKEARGKLDAAWAALEDYRDKILVASRTFIDDAYNSANTNDTTIRARQALRYTGATFVFGLAAAGLLYYNYHRNWSQPG